MFSDLASVSGANVVSALLALLSVTIVTHLLGPARYAILAYISLISGLMVTVTASWTATAVTRYGREELERDGSMRATNWSRLAIAAPVLAASIALVIVLKLLGWLPAELTWLFVAISLATGVGAVLTSHAVNLLEAGGRMKLAALGLSAMKALSILGIVVLILAGLAHSASAIALVWLATGILLAVLLGRAVWRDAFWPPRLDRAMRRRMLAFSAPMIAFSVSQYVIQGVDVVILGAFRSSRAVGLYAVAYQGYGVLQGLATTASIVLTPLLVSLRAADREDVVVRFLQRLVPQALCLVAVAAGLAAPAVRLAVPFVFGSRFTAAAAPLSLLLIAWLLYAAASFVAPILVLHERARAIALINVGAALVNVALDLLLVGALGMGIAAPAIATTAALAVVAVGYMRVAARCAGATPSRPIGMLLPALVGVVIALVVPGAALALLLGECGVLLTLVLVLTVLRPFAAQDAELLAKLDIPQPLKRRVLALVVPPASALPCWGFLPRASKSLPTSSARMEADDGFEGHGRAGRGIRGGLGGAFADRARGEL